MSVVMQKAFNETVPEISFTESAIKHLVSYLQQNAQYAGVRLSVNKTGCSGFSYVVDYVVSPAEDDLMKPLHESYVVCIDKGSYPFLKNMNVDYIKQGLNSRFVFNNPNQTGQCGCGESFTVD
ncbi:MAG: iron-sulfur cluster assembly accessory protein [Legionella sp.]|uniref:HesB/IscA family protein n=1 Tax=Legionella sp. TaxID=459 RepID=UPI0039E3F81D